MLARQRFTANTCLQQQEREAANEHNAANGAQNRRASLEIVSGGAVQQSGYEYEENARTAYESHSPEEYEFDHSYQAAPSGGGHHRTNGAVVGSGGGRSGGYSVAQTHDYLGYPKDQQPFDSRGLWENEEKAEDLW